jgi:uncharacterized protein (TIGR03066 family)
MNHLSKRAQAQLKQRKQTKTTARQGGHRTGWELAPRHWAVIALCLFLAAGGTFAVLELFIWNKVPPELVGTWEVTEGPMAGGTFEFSRTGALVTRVKEKGKYFTLRGDVQVEDRVLLTTTQHPTTGREQTRKSTIRELTESTLILELDNGEVLKLMREH